ncbi:hypothetical protein [Dolichospermum circinale]|uniref:hypothetical protein n=1 Tax=Dolichospermum circinale TaxID=109265 RepID=UPI00041B6B4B
MNNNLSSLRVRDIGEQGFLERLQRFYLPDVIGDDTAVLLTKPDQSLTALAYLY